MAARPLPAAASQPGSRRQSSRGGARSRFVVQARRAQQQGSDPLSQLVSVLRDASRTRAETLQDQVSQAAAEGLKFLGKVAVRV